MFTSCMTSKTGLYIVILHLFCDVLNIHALAGHNLNRLYQVLVVDCVYCTYDVMSVFYIYTYSS